MAEYDNLSDQAKNMAELYMARLPTMGEEGIAACSARVKQEHPKLYARLVHELREIRKQKKF